MNIHNFYNFLPLGFLNFEMVDQLLRIVIRGVIDVPVFFNLASIFPTGFSFSKSFNLVVHIYTSLFIDFGLFHTGFVNFDPLLVCQKVITSGIVDKSSSGFLDTAALPSAAPFSNALPGFFRHF